MLLFLSRSNIPTIFARLHSKMSFQEVGSQIIDTLWHRGRLLNRIDISTDALAETILDRVRENDRRQAKLLEEKQGKNIKNFTYKRANKTYPVPQSDHDLYERRVADSMWEPITAKIPIKKIIYYMYLIFDFLRLIFAAYASSDADLQWYFEYDLVIGAGFHWDLISAEMLIAIMPMLIFAFIIDYLFTVVPDAYVWNMINDFVVINIRHFRELNLSLNRNVRRQISSISLSSPSNDRVKSFANYFAEIRQLYAIWNMPENMIKFPQKLPHSKMSISAKIRCRAYVLSMALSAFHLWALLIFVFFLVRAFWLFSSHMLARATESWNTMAFAIFSGATFLADSLIVLQSVRYVLLALNADTVIGYVHTVYLRRLRNLLIATCNRLKRDNCRRCRKRKNRKSYSTSANTIAATTTTTPRLSSSQTSTIANAIRYMTFYRREHVLIGRDLLITNQRLMSIMLLATFGCNALFNMIMITRILLKPMSLIDQLICLLITVTQIMYTAAAILPLMIIVNEYHEGATLLAACQYNLSYAIIPKTTQKYRSRTTRTIRTGTTVTTTTTIKDKWKLLQCYETINTSQRIYFTIGKLKLVSRPSMLKFAAFYLTNLLFVIQLFLNNKTIQMSNNNNL